MPEETKTAAPVPNGTSVEARLAAARLRAEAKAQAREEEAKLRELALLELTEKLEEEHGGAGEVVVIDGGEAGPIGMKLGAAVLYKQWRSSIDKNQKKLGTDGITLEACQIFVTPCVLHPTKELFGQVVEKFPGLLYVCANALEALYTARNVNDRSKG